MFGFGRRRSIQPDDTAEIRQAGSALPFRDRLRSGWWSLYNHTAQFFSTVFLIVLIFVPIGLFIWLFFFTDVFIVQAITVVDARDETAAAAKEIIEEHVNKLPWGKNIFFVQAQALEAEILNRLPQTRTVHVTRKLPGTIKTIIQEKEPAFLLLSSGNYYYVDATGVVYEEARLETLPGTVLPTVKNDDTSSGVTIGVEAVEETFVDFVLDLHDLVPEYLNVQVGEIHIPSLAAREVHVILDTNWKILFDATRSVQNQMTILQTILRDTVSPEEREALEYVDLRVPNRVYYRTRLGDTEM